MFWLTKSQHWLIYFISYAPDRLQAVTQNPADMASRPTVILGDPVELYKEQRQCCCRVEIIPLTMDCVSIHGAIKCVGELGKPWFK